LIAELETRVDQLKASETDMKNLFYREKEVSVFKPLDLHGRYPQQGRR
jgi:hypothetical protein